MDKVNWREASRESALGDKLFKVIFENPHEDDIAEWLLTICLVVILGCGMKIWG